MIDTSLLDRYSSVDTWVWDHINTHRDVYGWGPLTTTLPLRALILASLDCDLDEIPSEINGIEVEVMQIPEPELV